MLRAGLRRFALLLLLAAALSGGAAVLVGLLLGSDLARAVSVGFYLMGSFLLVAGFFVGNRGPARAKEGSDAGPVAGMFGLGVGARGLRWATREEQEETIAGSAVFVLLGLALLVLGVIADSRVALI